MNGAKHVLESTASILKCVAYAVLLIKCMAQPDPSIVILLILWHILFSYDTQMSKSYR